MTLSEFLNQEYGPSNSPKRKAIEAMPMQYILGQFIAHERHHQSLSLEEVADRTELQASMLQTIEEDASDVHFSLLFTIIEEGLGRSVSIDIRS